MEIVETVVMEMTLVGPIINLLPVVHLVVVLQNIQQPVAVSLCRHYRQRHHNHYHCQHHHKAPHHLLYLI